MECLPMKIVLIALLHLSALPCAAADAPKPTPTEGLTAPVIEIADAALAKAQALLTDLNQRMGVLTGDSSAPSPCYADFSMDVLMRKIKAKEIPDKVLDGLLASNVMDIMRYYDYRAFANRDFSECDVLSSLPASFHRNVTSLNVPGDWVCRNELHCNQYGYHFVTRSPDFRKVCERWIEYRTPEFKKDAVSICKIMSSDASDPVKLCSKISQYPRIWPDDWTDPGGVTIKEDDCLAINKAYNGDDSLCHPEDGDECRDYARFAKAYKASDAKLCGDSNFCRLLMGAAADIANPFADRVRNRYCELAEPAAKGPIDAKKRHAAAAEASRLYSEGNRPILALIGGAEKMLTDTQLIASQDSNVSRSIADRSQRIARLKEKVLSLKPSSPESIPTKAP